MNDASLTREEKAQALRVGAEHPKQILAEKIHDALERSNGSFAEFKRECEKQGVYIDCEVSASGKISDVKFTLANTPDGFHKKTYTGSELGAEYSINSINSRLDHQFDNQVNKVRIDRAANLQVEKPRKDMSQEMDFDLKPRTAGRDKGQGIER